MLSHSDDGKERQISFAEIGDTIDVVGPISKCVDGEVRAVLYGAPSPMLVCNHRVNGNRDGEGEAETAPN